MCKPESVSIVSAEGSGFNDTHDLTKSSTSLLEHVPQIDLCIRAFQLVSESVAPSILNHSLRVFLFAKWLAEKEQSVWASEKNIGLLFVACICHDLGTSASINGDERFEVEGADAAVTFLTKQGVSEKEAHEVWTAIAIHTSPGIAERISPMARLVRLAVLIDFRPATRTTLGATDFGEQVEIMIPRLNIEKVLGDAVVHMALPKRAAKAPPASWPGVLVRSHLENPEWTGVNKAF